MALLDCVEHLTGPDPTHAVIWLHGLGADGHDFEPVVPALAWPGQPAIRYVFPHAPHRAVTVNGGMVMRAWYDIRGLDLAARVDAAGMHQSRDQLVALVDREQARGIPGERVVLAGFSQGGAVALYTALRLRRRLAGLVALSTYLALAEDLPAAAAQENAGLPVFMGHGTADPVVPITLGEQSADRLRVLGHPVEWHSYPIAHAVSPEEIDHVRAYLRARLGSVPAT